MTAPPAPLHERLEKLDAALAEAKSRRSRAGDARRARKRWQLGVEVTTQLREYVDAVFYGKREADPEEHARLQKELVSQVEERGLLFTTNKTGLIRLLDPAVEAEEAEANAAFVAAREERAAFVEENAEGLAAERRQVESEGFKEALSRGDVDAIREALDARPGAPTNTLVTADLPA